MKLDYFGTVPSRRLSIRAVCCGSIGLCCLGALAIALALVVLPSEWIGHPYMDLTEGLNPGIDAPDNWALATIYFVRLCASLCVAAVVFLVAGNPKFWWRGLRSWRTLWH